MTTKEIVERFGGIVIKSAITKNVEELAHKGRIQRISKKEPSKIPRSDVEKLVWSLCRTLRLIKSRGWRMEIAGSYRRGHEYVGDIDLVYSNSITDSSIMLVMHKQIEFWLESIPYNCDIVKCKSNEFPFALMYLTGNAEFNIFCRSRAKKAGLILNQSGLWNRETNEPIDDLMTELDIMERIGLRYVPPSKRDFKFFRT